MHDIELKSDTTIYIKQFKINEDQQEAVQLHVEELLKLGVVRPSNSKFNSSMFVVAKKDGGVQIVQDLLAINQKTMVDKYSMRDVQEYFDTIGKAGSSFFSTMDLTSGFWQMILSQECRKYTAFTIPWVGQFEWNASSVQQRSVTLDSNSPQKESSLGQTNSRPWWQRFCQKTLPK
jgi:hypothetical protein